LEQYQEYIPLGIGLLALVIQCWFLLLVYLRMALYRVRSLADEPAGLPGLSVIICARNEEENLRRNLESVLNQDYPDFEVVLVNDCSRDDSQWVLKELRERHPRLHVVTLKEDDRFQHGKKFAVTMGIKAAKHNLMVFTDADCRPQSDQWLRHMAGAFGEGTEIVLGYSPYTRLKGFLNRFIRFETFHTAISYLSHALGRNAYMGVGRNLAYSRELFFRGKGFASHMHILSGDDDLFVNQNARRRNTTICIHPEAHVWSDPKTSFTAYARQKRRHHGASSAYRARHKWMLALQMGSAVVFYLSLIVCGFLYPEFWMYLLGAYLLRLILQLLIFRPVMKKLQVLDLIAWLPLLDIIFYFYTSFNGLLSPFRKETRWK
jgi:biofilm PGA synthesis N-glycosyltransferase PgaC